MIRHWTSILGLLLSFFVFVNAGHPMWESAPRVKRSVPIDLNSDTVTPWPHGIVKYCWDDFKAREELAWALRAALNLWYAAGLDAERFKFVEYPREECLRDRRDSLMILRGPGPIEYASTVGKYVGPTTELVPGPIAIFNAEYDPIIRNRPGNSVMDKVMHQLGHIWGLYHEHQDPYYWPENPTWANIFLFQCENLVGFKEATEGKSHDYIWGPTGICTNRVNALQQGFEAAAHFLPMYELYHVPHLPDQQPKNDDVDWDSCMLYHSWTAGSLETTGITLRKVFGAHSWRILPKRAPSPLDVQGLIQLYDAAEQRPLPLLYHDPRSEHHTAFQRLQNYQACESPRGG